MLEGLGIRTSRRRCQCATMWEFFIHRLSRRLRCNFTTICLGNSWAADTVPVKRYGGTRLTPGGSVRGSSCGSHPLVLRRDFGGSQRGGDEYVHRKMTDLNLLTCQQSFSITSSSGTACASTGSGVCYYVRPRVRIPTRAPARHPSDHPACGGCGEPWRHGDRARWTYNNPAVSGVGSKLIIMTREGRGEPCGVHCGTQMGSEDRWVEQHLGNRVEFSANYIDVKNFECEGFSDTCMENYNGGSSSGGQFISITGTTFTTWTLLRHHDDRAGWHLHQPTTM